MNGSVKNGIDALAVGGAAVVWMDWLPSIAAILSIVWLTIRIGDWLWAHGGKRLWLRMKRLLFPFS